MIGVASTQSCIIDFLLSMKANSSWCSELVKRQRTVFKPVI